MMIEWVRQLGVRRAGDAHSWGAPPGVVSQARGAISVGSPSFPASSLARAQRNAPLSPPRLQGWQKNTHQLRSSVKMSQSHSVHVFHQSIINRTRASSVLSARGREGNLSRASRRKTLPLVCCRVRCGRSLCLRSRVRGRDALLSQAFPGVLARSSVWQAAVCFAAHCAMLGFSGQMWPVCCQTCMYDG